MRKLLATLATGLLVTGFVSTAVAETPKESTGFQAAVRTGIAIPMGSFSGGSGADMSDYFSPQATVIADVGGKFIPELFLGGYLGLGVGAATGTFQDSCDATNIDCGSFTFRLGLEAIYYPMPAQFASPWFGYGLGFEVASLAGTDDNDDTTSFSGAGLEFAHIMAGLDFRIHRIIGVGPFLDFSLGKYTRYVSESPGSKIDADIPDTALHEWFIFGARGVFFP